MIMGKKYVSPEDAKACRRKHELLAIELMKAQGEITQASMVENGIDVSVARRTLAEMADRGTIIARKLDFKGTLAYTLAPKSELSRPWIKWRPAEDFMPRYY